MDFKDAEIDSDILFAARPVGAASMGWFANPSRLSNRRRHTVIAVFPCRVHPKAGGVMNGPLKRAPKTVQIEAKRLLLEANRMSQKNVFQCLEKKVFIGNLNRYVGFFKNQISLNPPIARIFGNSTNLSLSPKSREF